MPETKVELYYAEWCHHCEVFLSEWDNVLVPMLQKEGITAIKYEEKKDSQKIEDENIQGYPTIKITKNGTTTEYNGPRKAELILDFIKNGNLTKIQGGKFDQCGGSLNKNFSYRKKKIDNNDDELYKIKYLKYKAKYMKLRSELGI